MPNGKPGDHPVSDLIFYNEHPFPVNIEALIRELQKLEPVDVSRVMWAQIYEKAWGWQIRGEFVSDRLPDQRILDEGRRWLEAQVRRLKERD